MCSQTEVARRALSQASGFQGIDLQDLKPEHELKKDLGYDDSGLPYLAMALRSHIGWCGGSGSVYTTELRKKKFNVRNLVQLMIKRTLNVSLTGTKADQRIRAAQQVQS